MFLFLLSHLSLTSNSPPSMDCALENLLKETNEFFFCNENVAGGRYISSRKEERIRMSDEGN
jgi:hypothetical protein